MNRELELLVLAYDALLESHGDETKESRKYNCPICIVLCYVESMAIDMKKLREKYAALKGCFDEARLRWWAAAEARSLGHGGVTYVAKATGLNRRTLHRGLRELARPGGKPSRLPLDRVRRPGGGRKRLAELDSKLSADLEALVDPYTRGDPQSPLRWTCKSTAKLATELNRRRHRVSARSVSKLLTDLD